MAGKRNWQRRFAGMLAGGYLVLSAAAVFAAPVELSLEDSIALALKNNPAIKISQADRESAAWAINEAKGGKQPSVGLEHTSRRAGGDSMDPGNSFSNRISLKLPIYTGGNLEGQIDKAKIGLESADLGVEKTRQQLKLDATNG